MYVCDEEKNRKIEQLFFFLFFFFEEEEDCAIRIISARKLTRADKKSLVWLRLGDHAAHVTRAGKDISQGHKHRT